MNEPAFSIRIVEQGWLGDDRGDHCSHGRIELTIGGQVLTAEDDQFGISESALALLRTLDSDYDPDRDSGLSAGLLLLHGCGSFLMESCPLGIAWSVEHTNSDVRIFAPRGTAIGRPPVRHGIDVVVPYERYEAEVIAFASEAKSLFDGVEKSGDWDFLNPYGELKTYDEFWVEFNNRLHKHQR